MSNKVKRKLKIFQKINGYEKLPQEQRNKFEAALITPKLKLTEIYEAMKCLNGLPYSDIEAVARSKRCPRKFVKVILTMMPQSKQFEVGGGEMGNGDDMLIVNNEQLDDEIVEETIEEINENKESIEHEEERVEHEEEEEDDDESLYEELEDLRNEVMELKIESTAVNTALKKLVDVVEESLKKINRNLNEKIETMGVLLPPKTKLNTMNNGEQVSTPSVNNNSNDKVDKIIRQMKLNIK